MSYRDNFEQERRKQAQDHTARIIHERLEKIVMGDPGADRRWFWELLQNARDVADSNRGIRVRVEITEGEHPRLAFSHDGDVFTSRDLVRLTEQDSSKRDEVKEGRPAPIGRFGTGFLTTHLLSRKVEIQGIVHDEREQPRLIRIPLDRSGDDIAGLRGGVEKTFAALAGLDEQEPLTEYEQGAFNTTFIYDLDEGGLTVARQGIHNLHQYLPITLALNQPLRSIEVVHEGVCYRRGPTERLDEGIEMVAVVRATDEGDETLSFVVVRGADTELVVPVSRADDRLQVLPLPGDMPRLFCAFPLIGSERFPMPVVVSSASFHPTEPRDGVWLGNVQNVKVTENKRLMQQVVGCYERLLTIAAQGQWRDLYVLAGVKPLAKHAMGRDSHVWYAANVLKPLRRHVQYAPIVETADGAYRPMRVADDNNPRVWFPKDDSPKRRDDIWRLAEPWLRAKLPRREDLEAWNEALWEGCPRLDMNVFLNTIEARKTVQEMAEWLDASTSEALVWLNELIAFLDGNGYVFWKRAIFPNKNGVFRLKHQLYVDDGIDEGLKDLCEAMGRRLRGELLHPAIRAGVSDHQKRTAKEVARDIEAWVRERIKQNNRDPRVFRMLLNWFDEHPEEAEKLFPLYQDQHLLQTAEEARAIRMNAEKAERLETENQALIAEVEQLRNRLKDAPDTLPVDPADEAVQAGLRHMAQEFMQIWETIQSVINEISEPILRKAYLNDLSRLLEERPELFRHLSESTRESYLRWVEMVQRAKAAVKKHLASMPQYDATGWTDDERFPTLVTGVMYYGRPLTLVIRPSDEEYIVLYDEMEKAVLEGPGSELWIEGGSFPAQRFNLGKLVRLLGINRLPLRVPTERPAVLYLS